MTKPKQDIFFFLFWLRRAKINGVILREREEESEKKKGEYLENYGGVFNKNRRTRTIESR